MCKILVALSMSISFLSFGAGPELEIRWCSETNGYKAGYALEQTPYNPVLYVYMTTTNQVAINKPKRENALSISCPTLPKTKTGLAFGVKPLQREKALNRQHWWISDASISNKLASVPLDELFSVSSNAVYSLTVQPRFFISTGTPYLQPVHLPAFDIRVQLKSNASVPAGQEK